MRLEFRLLTAATALAWASAAHAGYPGLSLSFAQPSGSARSGDPIEVYLRLSLDPGAASLDFDGTSGRTEFGLAPGTLPTTGNGTDGSLGSFASYTRAFTNTSWVCTGTFTNGCGPGAYSFDFHTSDSDGKPTFNFLKHVKLAPGQSLDFLFGTFNPVGGAAPVGIYSFSYASVDIQVAGLDAKGHALYGGLGLAGTSGDPSFTRLVTAVPEPERGALMLAGLGVLAWAARRRRVAAAPRL